MRRKYQRYRLAERAMTLRYSLHRDHQHVLVVDIRDTAEVAIVTVQITVEALGIISF